MPFPRVAGISNNAFFRSFDGIAYATYTPGGGPFNTPLDLFLRGSLYMLERVGSNAQIWRSFDSGATFVRIGVQAAAGSATGNSKLYVTARGTFLVAGTGIITRSVDGGNTWTTISIAAADNFFVSAFCLEPGGASIQIIVDDNTNTAKSGRWASSDDGATWAQQSFPGTAPPESLQAIGDGNVYNANSTPFNLLRVTPPLSAPTFCTFTSGDATETLGINRWTLGNDNGSALLALGSDGIWRTWATSDSDEYHTSSPATCGWTAGPLAVANAPNLGVLTITPGVMLGGNGGLASLVLSQNNGSSWTSLAIPTGAGTVTVLLSSDDAGKIARLRGTGMGAGVGGFASGIRFPRVPLIPRP